MFNKSVDSILKAFNTAISDLAKLEEAKTKEIDHAEIMVKEANDKITAAKAERQRAEVVRGKLEGIVNV